jgi:hypothetical protein
VEIYDDMSFLDRCIGKELELIKNDEVNKRREKVYN